MVRAQRSQRDQRRQAQGLESPETEYQSRMVQRFEKTGKLATSAETRRHLAPAQAEDPSKKKLTKGDKRMLKGRDPMTRAEVKKLMDERAATIPTVYVYPCHDCGITVECRRKQGPNITRCPACRRKARLATKRSTWHRHKERYAERKRDAPVSIHMTQEPAPIKPEPVPERIPLPPRPIAGGRRVVWSPN